MKKEAFYLIIGILLIFPINSQEIPDNVNIARGQFFSITLPNGWVETNNHEYLNSFDYLLGFDHDIEGFSRYGFMDINNDENFLYVSELKIQGNISTEEMMKMIDSPAKKTNIGNNEFYIIDEPFFYDFSTVRSAFIIKNKVWFTFIFLLSNSNLDVADRAFEAIEFMEKAKPVFKDGFIYGLRLPYIGIYNIFAKEKIILNSISKEEETSEYRVGAYIGLAIWLIIIAIIVNLVKIIKRKI
ncbi:MAG: hypothetical protein FWD47_09910 [Treponema sp.]|nr:hypothetical protein [Treponema sp.]